MTVEQAKRKIAGLASRTVSNGCTAEEQDAAQKIARKLHTKYVQGKKTVDTKAAAADAFMNVYRNAQARMRGTFVNATV